MIEAKGLTKYYGSLAAARDVSFELGRGDILGFLGPNGAGKSTTMKLLTTFLYPTRGTATVGGFDILERPLEVRRAIGYLPENAPLYEEMTVRDFLRFAASARRVKPVRAAVDRVIERCFIAEVKDRPIHTLSKGYRQRVCFAQALIHDPDILILDEPTDGLDPNQKTEVRRMITAMGEDKAILLSTHILDEALAICNRAIIISEGEIRVDDTPQALIRRAPGHGTVELTVGGGEVGLDEVKRLLEQVPRVAGVTAEASPEGVRATVVPEPGADVSGPVLERVKGAGFMVSSVSVAEGSFEDVFRQYTLSATGS